jgi:short-subunit dehydrogenase
VNGEAATPLAGRVAVVTGASRGIGAAVAGRLAGAGAAVAAVARASAELQGVASAIQATGGVAIAVAVDLSELAAADRVMAEVSGRLGPVDILVNNAAIQRFLPALELSVEDFSEQVSVNLVAPFALARAMLPGMVERGGGWIVNIASDLAYRSIATGSAYCASKRGLVALSECLQLEHRAHGIRVTVIMPGAVASGWDGVPSDDASKAGQLRPDDVADAVLWSCTRPADSRVDQVVIHPMTQDS